MLQVYRARGLCFLEGAWLVLLTMLAIVTVLFLLTGLIFAPMMIKGYWDCDNFQTADWHSKSRMRDARRYCQHCYFGRSVELGVGITWTIISYLCSPCLLMLCKGLGSGSNLSAGWVYPGQNVHNDNWSSTISNSA